jgi:arsenate reductase-like glutaredoxin family protein
MDSEFKLDINIPQKNIEGMAKKVIREIIEEKIEEAMKNINIEKIIADKLNTIDSKISKNINQSINKRIDGIEWNMRNEYREIARKAVLEEIQKKPLTGNVYIKLDNYNVETDYDD